MLDACLTNFKAVTAEQETERRDARHRGQFNHPRCGSGRKRSALRPRDQGTPPQDWPHARPGGGGGPALGQGRRGPRPGEPSRRGRARPWPRPCYSLTCRRRRRASQAWGRSAEPRPRQRVRTNATGKAPRPAAGLRERLQTPGEEARGRLPRAPRVSGYTAGRGSLGPSGEEDCFRAGPWRFSRGFKKKKKKHKNG